MNTKPNITPGRPGAAHVEYRACQEDVEAMLAKGYSVRMVYEAMNEQGRVTCSYSAFCDYARGEGRRLHSRKKKCSQSNVQTPQRTGPIIVKSSPRTFLDPKDVDPKDCF